MVFWCSTSPFITFSQVGRALSKLRIIRSMVSDHFNPRLLKACAGVFQHLFNLSLRLKKFAPTFEDLLRYSGAQERSSQYLKWLQTRGADLTGHEDLFRDLVLQYLMPILSDSLDPLKFAYQAQISVVMQSSTCCIGPTHIWRGWQAQWKSCGFFFFFFYNFSSAFNAIWQSAQPCR